MAELPLPTGALPLTPALSTRGRIWTQVLAVLVLVPAGFLLLQQRMRDLEAALTVGTLHLFGAGRGVPLRAGSAILVVPAHHPAFYAVVSPACSSLPSVLALVGIAAVIPTAAARGRRGRALLAAVVLVVTGNIIRMASSIAVGLWAGEVSLVLFHNWAGSIFGFAYTLFGFSLMIWMMMGGPRPAPAPGAPAEPAPTAAARHAHP